MSRLADRDLLDQLVEQLAQRIAAQLHQLQQGAKAEAGQSSDASPWLNIQRAAAYLDWPAQRLYKLTAAGAIPHYKHESRLLFHKHELDNWLQQHRQSPTG